MKSLKGLRPVEIKGIVGAGMADQEPRAEQKRLQAIFYFPRSAFRAGATAIEETKRDTLPLSGSPFVDAAMVKRRGMEDKQLHLLS